MHIVWEKSKRKKWQELHVNEQWQEVKDTRYGMVWYGIVGFNVPLDTL